MFESHNHPSLVEGSKLNHGVAVHALRPQNGYHKKPSISGPATASPSTTMNGHAHSHTNSGGGTHKHTASCSHSHNHSHPHAQTPSRSHTHSHARRLSSVPMDVYEPGKRSSVVLPSNTHIHAASPSISHSHSHSHSHAHSHSHSLSTAKLDTSFGTAPARKIEGIKPINFLVPTLVTISYIIAEIYTLPGAPLDPFPTTPRKEGVNTNAGITRLLSSLSYASTLGGIALIINLFLPWKVEWKGGKPMGEKLRAKMQDDSMLAAGELALGVLASFFAVVQLGAVRAALFIACALTVRFDGSWRSEGLVRAVKARKAVSSCLLVLAVFDIIYWNWSDPLTTIFAYVLLFGSLTALREPISLISGIGSSKSTSLKAGLGLIFLAVAHWAIASVSVDELARPVEQRSIFVGIIASSFYALTLSFSTPRIGGRIPNPLPPLSIVAIAVVLSHFIPLPQQASMKDAFLDASAVALAYTASMVDSKSAFGVLQLTENTPHPDGQAKAYEPSRATKLLIGASSGFPLLRSILVEKESRRIFYFMLLNFAFMLVQTAYGFWTGSLGLLSDSIHMLFDCIALGVGLAASVLSKRPATLSFPYGLGNLDTLAGFGNGIFLMLISWEIVVEAVERLSNPSPMQRLNELLIVSALGFIVNIVGLTSFGHHHHHGHDHGCSGSHSHSHGPSPTHFHDHDHHHDHDHDHKHDHHDHAHEHSHSHTHNNESNKESNSLFGHSHGDNMEGIFLHVMADTLGSLSVVFSTALIKYYGWAGFDPLASLLIAVLIFASAIPLVKSSAKKLLLTVPGNTEYTLRDKLGSVSAVHGVQGYSAPKFWVENGRKVNGVIHVQVQKGVDSTAVKEKIKQVFGDIDVLVQVETTGAGEMACWCSAGKSGDGR